jgi:23S rRNA U2552 (ribose-2'-O)-methylase RlmE/FtsJ
MIFLNFIASVSLIEIYQQHNDLLADKWESYFDVYEDEMSIFRNLKDVSILEFGIANGGSLQIWKKFFGSTSKIYGIDIDTSLCEKLKFEDGIEIACFDASNKDNLELFFSNKEFSVIIDDASHIASEIINTFIISFKKLIPGNFHVIFRCLFIL